MQTYSDSRLEAVWEWGEWAGQEGEMTKGHKEIFHLSITLIEVMTS